MITNSVRWAAATLIASLIVGCSGGEDFPVGRVKGHVTYQGQPVVGAVVQFMPQAGSGGNLSGKSAIATTDSKGEFTLSTYTPGDGAVIGTHTVEVDSQDPDKPLSGKVPAGLTVNVQRGKNNVAIELVPDPGPPQGQSPASPR